MARPVELDDLKAKRIVDAIAKGLPRSTAAKLARCSPSAIYAWLARGRKGEPRFKEFLERVVEAEAQAEEEMVAVVRSCAKEGSYQAATWWLERRRHRLYIARKAPEQVATGLEHLSEEQVKAELAKELESAKKAV